MNRNEQQARMTSQQAKGLAAARERKARFVNNCVAVINVGRLTVAVGDYNR